MQVLAVKHTHDANPIRHSFPVISDSFVINKARKELMISWKAIPNITEAGVKYVESILSILLKIDSAKR